MSEPVVKPTKPSFGAVRSPPSSDAPPATVRDDSPGAMIARTLANTEQLLRSVPGWVDEQSRQGAQIGELAREQTVQGAKIVVLEHAVGEHDTKIEGLTTVLHEAGVEPALLAAALEASAKRREAEARARDEKLAKDHQALADQVTAMEGIRRAGWGVVIAAFLTSAIVHDLLAKVFPQTFHPPQTVVVQGAR